MQKINITYPDGTDAGMRFTEHLTEAILNVQLAPGFHDTGDWLKLLDLDELGKLAQIIEGAFREPDNVHPDIPNVLLQLVFLETGGKQVAVSLDELVDFMQFLLMMCQIETYARQGYIQFYGRWRITDPNDENHYASLTELGHRVASEPGAPAFLRYLKQQTSSSRRN